MNKTDVLRGVYAPITTPFNSDESVNYDGLKSNMEVYAKSGIQGYLALGSNGENKSLYHDEKRKVLECIVKNKAAGQKVMAGCIAESTRETIDLAKMAEAVQVDFVTLLPPSYFAKQMTDEALERYFVDVADSVKVPVLVYCAPQFSAGIVLSQNLIKILSKHPNIIGLKDSSSGNIDGYLRYASEDFAIIAGSANFFIHTLENGGVGGIISLANVFPVYAANLYRTYLEGNKEEYDKANKKTLKLDQGVSGCGGAYSDLLEQQMRKHLNRNVEYLNTFPQILGVPMH